jgi:hypothetical protein
MCTLQALAVMFVWVAVGGVMTAVERLDVAGSRLMTSNSNSDSNSNSRFGVASAAGPAGGSGGGDLRRDSMLFSKAPSKLGLEAAHIQQQQHMRGGASWQQQLQRQQQQQQQQQPSLPLHRSASWQPSQLQQTRSQALPVAQLPPAAATAAATTARWWWCALDVIRAVLVVPMLTNIAGFWLHHLLKLSPARVRSMLTANQSMGSPTA